MHTKVTIRRKPVKGNRLALYLDFYPKITDPETGKTTRQREFLGIFLHDNFKHEEIDSVNEKGKAVKRIIVHNGKPYYVKQDNKMIAIPTKKIRLKLDAYSENDNELAMVQAEKARIRWDAIVNSSDEEREERDRRKKIKDLENRNFIEYFRKLADQKSDSSRESWDACYNYLVKYTGEAKKFKEIDESYCEGFRDFLLTTKSIRHGRNALAPNSAITYFGKFKTAIRKAYRQGYLPVDYNNNLTPIKKVEIPRQYLTQEELNRLAKAECQNPTLKRAALFSALTGLRHCDIMQLTWGKIEWIEGDGYVIHFTQQKTGGVEYMPISDQAYSFCGERQSASKKVFEGLIYSAHYNRHLFQWIGNAGITKPITFHSFRNTFAVLQLSNGTDIYTVSKMLGHKDLKTTQHYAQIVDATKRKAANNLSIEI